MSYAEARNLRDCGASEVRAWLPSSEGPTSPVTVREPLTVRVRDTEGRAVPGAWVLLDRDGTRKGSLSDANGVVRLPAMAPGMYRLLVRSDGSAPFTVNVTFPAPLPVDVRLSPASGVAGW